jgi:hypothetical protein
MTNRTSTPLQEPQLMHGYALGPDTYMLFRDWNETRTMANGHSPHLTVHSFHVQLVDVQPPFDTPPFDNGSR